MDAYFEPEPVEANQRFDAVCTIENRGSAATGTFNVTWRFVPGANLRPIEWTVGDLAPGQQATLRRTVPNAPQQPSGYGTRLIVELGGNEAQPVLRVVAPSD